MQQKEIQSTELFHRKKDLHLLTSVSYTHLDVYKRQAVGLPDGQMGNSEVGHLNMGAGRIVYQDLTKITKAIQDGEFFENKALIAACENVKSNDSALHLMGLMSDGGVHSHIEHVFGPVSYTHLDVYKRQM